MSEPGDMPRAAVLLALLLLPLTAAMPQTGGAAPPGGGPVRLLKPWDAPPAAAYAALPDTVPGTPRSTGEPDSVAPDSADAPRGTKDSWTAIGLSAVLPGAGQVYTENYWKVPVILGLGGYWIYEWNRNDDRYDEYSALYDESIATSPPYGNEQYLALREAYKDQRDSFAWYLGILYLVNVVDAYVGAELYDFDVGPDLGAGGVGASATLRIHL